MKGASTNLINLRTIRNTAQTNAVAMQQIEKFVKSIMKSVRVYLEKKEYVKQEDAKILLVDIMKSQSVQNVLPSEKNKTKMIY